MLVSTILKNREKIRFHTPGHGALASELLSCDITELSYSDNLAAPTGDIKDLEIFLASAYNAESAFLSTQGATLNIMQALYAIKELGAVLTVGKTHLSVFNAARLFRIKTYHTDKLDLSTVPADVKTVILTSPDYFGRILNLPILYKNVKEKGLVLIVDSAHGAHFNFSIKLPISASQYSDLAILSLHKTMPVITGGSLLLTKKEYAERCLYARSLMHSTSPNYMTMCSMESAVKDFSINGERYYNDIFEEIKGFSAALKKPFEVLPTDDFSRLTVVSPYDGETLKSALFVRGFVPEMSMGNTVTFIVTPYNYYHLKLLCKCINDLPELKKYTEDEAHFKEHRLPTELFFGKDFISVPIEDSVGKRVFNEIGLYPPGVPLLYSGETMTYDTLKILLKYKERAFGLDNTRVRVVK